MTKERKNNSGDRIRVGISVGDINGVGMEVIIKTFLDNRMLELCTPIVYGSDKVASFHRKALGITDFSFNIAPSPDQLNTKRANLINCWEEDVKVTLGESTPDGGKYAFKSLKAATEDLASNKVDVLITAPINKHNIQSEEFDFPGHTEYLANYANEDNPLMILVNGGLRVGVATGHISVKEVAEQLTSELILTKLQVMQKSLRQDFKVVKPKIAVLGLNPHAGDNGLIGEEENRIIVPAIRKAQDEGILTFGPFPADGFFGSSVYTQFDGILAMYHDQGLIPFKTLSFGNGVNFTAGLPIVRTSPDHGTAYNIAGKNEASEQSFREAVYLACDIYNNRKEFKALTANPLVPGKQGKSRRF